MLIVKYKIGDLFIEKDRNKYQISHRWVILSIDRAKYFIGLKKDINEYFHVKWLFESELEEQFNYIKLQNNSN